MIKKWGSVAIAVSIFYGVLWVLGTGCPIKFVTGISCMGCGMMRATWSLLHLRFHEAMTYHPLVFCVIPFGLWFMLKKRIPEKIYKIGVWAIVLTFVIVYVGRMLNPEDTIVVFEPQNGIVMRAIRSLLFRQ